MQSLLVVMQWEQMEEKWLHCKRESNHQFAQPKDESNKLQQRFMSQTISVRRQSMRIYVQTALKDSYIIER